MSPVSNDVRLAVCFVHSGNPTDTRLLHEHHRKPRGLGGTNDPENLVWLCGSCHDVAHRMAQWARSGKSGLVSDLAVRYLPNGPAARKRLLEIVADISKAMNEFDPDADVPDGAEDEVTVQLRVPRELHGKLKALAYSHKHAKSGRRVGLYSYILNILENHVALTQAQSLKRIQPEKLFGVDVMNDHQQEQDTTPPTPIARRTREL